MVVKIMSEDREFKLGDIVFLRTVDSINSYMKFKIIGINNDNYYEKIKIQVIRNKNTPFWLDTLDVEQKDIILVASDIDFDEYKKSGDYA